MGAFSLLELLVVIALIGVLAALLMPTLGASKAKAQGATCLSNLRHFVVAFQLYAGDHEDAVLPNQDGQNVTLGRTWVEGWLGVPGPDCTNLSFLQRSLVGPYLSATSVWLCPSSRTPMPRVRTVSLNCFMGSPKNITGVSCYRRLAQITRPSPSYTLTFVDERIDTVNDGSFAMQWDFDENHPGSWVLRDKPGVVHNGGCTLGYADGHTAIHRWRDLRTLAAPRNDAVMTGNRDVLWLQQHGTLRGQ